MTSANLYKRSLAAIRLAIQNLGGSPPRQDNFLLLPEYLEALANSLRGTGASVRVSQLNGLVGGQSGGAVAIAPDGSLILKFFGVANGLLELGSDSKIPAQFLPQSIAGGLNFLGAWDADANEPVLGSGALYQGSVAEAGSFLVVSAAGSTVVDGDGPWSVGDWVLSGGAGGGWIRLGQVNGQVISVRGEAGAAQIGEVVLAPSDLHAYLGAIAALIAPDQQSALVFNGTNWAWLAVGGNLGILLADSSGRLPADKLPTLTNLKEILNPEYLQRATNLSDLTNAATARSNLGIPALLANYVEASALTAAIAAHEAAADPHPGYLTLTEGEASFLKIATYGAYLASQSGAAAGFLVKLADNTFQGRSIQGSAGVIEVANGSGIGGNPTINLATQPALQAGTYAGITLNSRGIATAADAAPGLPQYTIASLPSAVGRNGARVWVSDAVSEESGWSNAPGIEAIARNGAWTARNGTPLSTQSYYRNISSGSTATLDANNRVVRCSAGTLTLTLAPAAQVTAGIVEIKNTSASLSATLLPSGTDTIDGYAFLLLTPKSSINLRVFNSEWQVF